MNWLVDHSCLLLTLIACFTFCRARMNYTSIEQTPPQQFVKQLIASIDILLIPIRAVAGLQLYNQIH